MCFETAGFDDFDLVTVDYISRNEDVYVGAFDFFLLIFFGTLSLSLSLAGRGWAGGGRGVGDCL